MRRVKAIVLTGYGLNCDSETEYSFRLAGAECSRVHLNELIDNKDILKESHIFAFIGGFSWADDHGAGVILASKIRNHLFDEIQCFIEEGKLIIGICNGFQALANLGLLPGLDKDSWERKVALTYNDSGNFVDRWVKLKVSMDSPCVFTKGILSIELPVRHGEGKFYAPEEVVDALIQNNQVVLRYEENPNGSVGDIAGICDPTGKIFGLMPHPEAFNHPTNHPDWIRREKEKFDKGEGIKIFENAVHYIEENIL